MEVNKVNERIERRKHQRKETHVPLKYSKLRDSSGNKEDRAITKDISPGGACFKIEKFISMANRLIVELKLPEKEKPIKAIAKIAWIKRSSFGNAYETGNQFLEMSKEDRDSITEYVNNFGESNSFNTE